MGIIKVLDKNTIDKIAAGEVVERPVSIVKELIENSIDAKANMIEVEIKNGGKSYIKITDNGMGILKDDIDIIFMRHATSKISSIDDLYITNTLGFRGEALSSIAAVSRVYLISKSVQEEIGNSILIEGGRKIEKKEVATNNGTIIEVRDLFFNVPVRFKFLKSDTTESSQISDIIERLALCNSDIAFNFINNGKNILKTTGFGDLKEVIFDIYGQEVYDNLLKVDNEMPFGHLTGFIGKPIIARGNRNRQSFFINNRYIKSYTLTKAIQEAYSSFLMQHQYPFFVLKLDLDRTMLDINVHPSKMEVSFENASVIYKELYYAIRNRLTSLNLDNVNSIDYDDKNSYNNKIFYNDIKSINDNQIENNNIDNFISDITNNISFRKDNYHNFINNSVVAEDSMDYDEKALFVDENIIKEPIINLIGQVFNTYILAQIDDKLYIVDQHAAHEKINFEKFIKNLDDEKISTQELLMPVVLNLTAKEELTINKYMNDFIKLGFEIEHFGGMSYNIRSVPMSFYKLDIKDLFIELLDKLYGVNDVKNIDFIKDSIANVACKASIKGGQILSDIESRHLIQELLKLDAPFNCPHGRPTMISISKYELEKKFKRIV